MAYTVHTVSRSQVSSNYGTAAKSIADEIAASFPGITLLSITTDSSGTYDALYTVQGCTTGVLRLGNFNSNSNRDFIVSFGVDPATANNYGRKQLKVGMNNGAGVSLSIINTDGIYVFRNYVETANHCLWFGILHSKLDNSTIEVVFANSMDGVVLNSENDFKGAFVPKYNLWGDAQKAALTGNTYMLCETVMTTNSAYATKAPYLVNGHGPYTVYSGETLPGFGAIFTNGTDYFVIVDSEQGNCIAFRL